jgi:hypothetical protein
VSPAVGEFALPFLDGIVGVPLLAAAQIRWRFFPQSMGDCAAAVLIGAACLACDWFFYQWRTGGTFFTKPDWTKLIGWRFLLPALLQATCLLAVLFLLSRFYFYSVVKLEPNWPFRPQYPRLDPNAFFWAGIAITATIVWQLYHAKASWWRMASLGVVAGLLVTCRWLHPAGALAIPLLVAGALFVGKRTTTLAVLVVALYLSSVSPVPQRSRSITVRPGIPYKRPISHADIHTWLVLAAMTTPTLTRTGLRYGLDVVILAMLSQQAAYFAPEIARHYKYRYDEQREFYLDAGLPVPDQSW